VVAWRPSVEVGGNVELNTIKIDNQRLRASFEALSEIGRTAEGGSHRPALSEADLDARAWFREEAERAGLEYSMDGAGNQSAVLRCGSANAPHILLGSHLDTVPNGGRFDGALGISAALEVLRTVQDTGCPLSTSLEAINLTDEEGAHIGEMGSQALTGKLSAEYLDHPALGMDAFESGLRRLGLTRESIVSARRRSEAIAGYLELHIEQGPRLVESGLDIGIVTGIVGIRRFKLRFLGRADHAGTTPLDRRRDAGQAACGFVVAAWQAVLHDFSDCAFNVGHLVFEPGAFNVVPEAVTASVEFRASSDERLDTLQARLTDVARRQATASAVETEIGPIERVSPMPMSPEVQRILAREAQALGLRHISLASKAGHDAQSFADVCPTGMIFVPSVGGRSHAPSEFSHWQDCLNGVNLLLHAAVRLASCSPAA
jgi:N-carbamoyl-L-amino-acid hydrolase